MTSHPPICSEHSTTIFSFSVKNTSHPPSLWHRNIKTGGERNVDVQVRAT